MMELAGQRLTRRLNRVVDFQTEALTKARRFYQAVDWDDAALEASMRQIIKDFTQANVLLTEVCEEVKAT